MKGTLFLVGVLVASGAQALVLDDFMSGPYSVSLQTGTDTASQNGTMIGGSRRTFLEVESNPLNQFLDLTIGNGFSITSSGTLLNGYTELTYGDQADLNANLSGFDRFKVHFVSNDLPQKLLVGLGSTSGGGQFEVVSMNVPAGVGFDVFVMFSSFTSFNQFQDVDFIGFGFDTGANGDFAIGKLEVVPEPATIAALGVGLAALVARRRKKA